MSYHIRLRPDLRTANGEVQDIMIEDRYAGTLILVFREGHRLAGSVQLDAQSVPEDAKEEIIAYVQQYLLQYRDAVSAEHFDILLTWGEVESVLGDEDGYDEDLISPQQSSFSDPPSVFLYEDEGGEMQIELISAGRSVSQFELQNEKGHTIAHAVLKQYGTDIQGEVNWLKEPLEEELDSAEELLVAEVDDQEIDTITIEMKYKDNMITVLELVRQDDVSTSQVEDIGPDWDEDGMELISSMSHEEEEADEACYVTLIRHDREIVSYDLFLQEHGGLPVGAATVDISEAAVSGYIDFYIEPSEEQRHQLVMVLAREVEKELEVIQLHITMLYRNVVIDEILLTSDTD
ncbi:hypothetical protein [Paenibacillus sp. Marseille-Q4541]|uniref:hypothetical protein n=1 Tax=Paenibacillus sp. Marseille-Q4541 TaxID=2831522 RepID=UPI001BA90F08|nr:hypothetical protein [Paenibacillus sp. Marseille-Q4541]